MSYLQYANRKAKERQFEVGDKVWYRTHFLSDASKGITAKFMPKREGPYVITSKITPKVYDVRSEDGLIIINKAHINDLTSYNSSQQ